MNYVKSSKKNIMLYDEDNKIISEYHTDDNLVEYIYSSDGKIVKSKDCFGDVDEYIYNSDGSTTVKTYKNNKLVSEHKHAKPIKYKKIITKEKEDKLKQSAALVDSGSTSSFNGYYVNTIASTTSYEDYYVNGILMNDIAVSRPNHSEELFVRKDAMSLSEIQGFLFCMNSILKDDIEIWRKSSSGIVYYTGTKITPSKVIYDAQQSSWVNAKVILATLQKESSLIGAPPGSVSYSSRRFYFAMGMGATDGGDYNSYTGFDYQVRDGADLLYYLFWSAPYTMPVKLTVNNGKTTTYNGVTYKGYIWVKNWGTYSLYKYTPWTIDTALLPQIGGGNYLFVQIFRGYWGYNWY